MVSNERKEPPPSRCKPDFGHSGRGLMSCLPRVVPTAPALCRPDGRRSWRLSAQTVRFRGSGEFGSAWQATNVSVRWVRFYEECDRAENNRLVLRAVDGGTRGSMTNSEVQIHWTSMTISCVYELG